MIIETWLELITIKPVFSIVSYWALHLKCSLQICWVLCLLENERVPASQHSVPFLLRIYWSNLWILWKWFRSAVALRPVFLVLVCLKNIYFMIIRRLWGGNIASLGAKNDYSDPSWMLCVREGALECVRHSSHKMDGQVVVVSANLEKRLPNIPVHARLSWSKN